MSDPEPPTLLNDAQAVLERHRPDRPYLATAAEGAEEPAVREEH